MLLVEQHYSRKLGIWLNYRRKVAWRNLIRICAYYVAREWSLNSLPPRGGAAVFKPLILPSVIRVTIKARFTMLCRSCYAYWVWWVFRTELIQQVSFTCVQIWFRHHRSKVIFTRALKPWQKNATYRYIKVQLCVLISCTTCSLGDSKHLGDESQFICLDTCTRWQAKHCCDEMQTIKCQQSLLNYSGMERHSGMIRISSERTRAFRRCTALACEPSCCWVTNLQSYLKFVNTVG